MSISESSPVGPALSQVGVGEPELKLWNGLTIVEWCREVPSSVLGLLLLLLPPKAALASRCSHDPAALTNLTVDKMPTDQSAQAFLLGFCLPSLYLGREGGECLGTSVTD